MNMVQQSSLQTRKIGIDATNLHQGGGVTHIIELLNNANPKEHFFDQIVIWGSNSTLDKIDNKSWIKKQNHLLLNKSLLFRTFWKIFFFKKSYSKHRCTILFVPGGTDLSNITPSVTMCRNMLPFEFKEAIRFGFSLKTLKLFLLRFTQTISFKKASGVIFLTDYAFKYVSQIINLNNSTTIIQHGINEKFFLNPRKVNRAFDTTKPCKLVYVSITDPYKHHINLLKAIKLLIKENVNITIDLIGPKGKCHSIVSKIADEINSERKIVNLIGPISYNEIQSFYKNADIGIFASSCENLPNILIELMAAGLPIACSNYGPMPEILKECGVYFDPMNVIQIKDSILQLYESQDLRSKNAECSFNLAKKYSWKVCADKTFNYLAKF
jgi:glycosyltransferase involved in cell wall biosynthesis